MRYEWMFLACDAKRKKIRVVGGMTTALRSIANEAAKKRAPRGSKVIAIKAGSRSGDEIAEFLKSCGVEREAIAPLIRHLGRKIDEAVT